MALSRDLTGKIKELLNTHPDGLSITDIVREIPLNRNTISRYLDILLISGQVEMRHFGMAKIYSLSRRLPVSSVLSLSSEYVLQLDRNLRVIYLNDPFLVLLNVTERDCIGRKVDATRIPDFFGDQYTHLNRLLNEGLAGVDRKEEITLVKAGRVFVCRVSPAVFTDGTKGVSVLFEDVTLQRRDEARLLESEEKFRTFVEASADGILVSDAEGCVMVWNEALARITGIPIERAEGVPVTEIMQQCLVPERRSRESINSIASQMKRALKGGTSRFFHSPIEMEIQRPDGTRRTIQQSHFPIATSRGILMGSVVQDITERRQMLVEIQAREERFRTLFNNSADMITVHGFTSEGLPGKFIEVNNVGCRRLGYSRGELLRMSPRDILDPACSGAVRKNAQKLLEQGSAVFEMTHIARDGRKIPVEVRSHVFEYQGEKLVIGQVRDLTDRKEAEDALRESGERLQMALSGADTGMWELNIQSMQGTVDERAAQILGYEKEDIGSHKTAWDHLSHPDDVPHITQRLIEYLEGRSSSFESEHRMRHASGRWVWISGRGRITKRTPEGAPLRISGTLHDITRRKEAEDALRQSESHLKSIIHTAPVGIGIVLNRVFLEVNDQMCEMTGYAAGELVGHPVRLLYTTDEEYDHVAATAYGHISTRGAGSVETFWTRKDQKIVHVLLSLTPLDPADSSAGLIFTALDITSRKESEIAVRASEERYRKLLEQSFDGVVIHRDGYVLLVNERAMQLLGASSPDELVGRPVRDFVHPDYREVVLSRIQDLDSKIDQNLPLMHQTYLRVDGQPLDVEVMSAVFLEDGTPCVRTVFRDISKQVALERILTESEQRYRTLAESATDMIYITECDGALVYANTLCARLFRCTQEELAGKRQTDLFPPDVAEVHSACIRKVVTTGNPVDHTESISTPAGPLTINVRLSPIRSPSGEIVSVLGIARDVSQVFAGHTTGRNHRHCRKTWSSQ